MLYAFIAVIVLHIVILVADIWSTKLFLERGGREASWTLSFKFMNALGLASWWAPKVALSVLLGAIAGYVWWDGTYPGFAIAMVGLPLPMLGTVGVYQNFQWLRTH
jgi:hypothetical protein